MKLPGVAQEIAEVIGREKTLLLIGYLPRCGRRTWRCSLYVPQRLRPDHQLVRVLGWRDAERLVREFGGMILQPSNCNFIMRRFRDATIRRLAGEGRSPREIATAIQLSHRHVRNILAEIAPEDSDAVNDNTGSD